mmetsp:Transcript_14004/g.29311  ORF Transcript_14004/g.29311 Transcript_14004/m.29311 type:complete len:272 (-) Transcript_14004:497-1312(-)
MPRRCPGKGCRPKQTARKNIEKPCCDVFFPLPHRARAPRARWRSGLSAGDDASARFVRCIDFVVVVVVVVAVFAPPSISYFPAHSLCFFGLVHTFFSRPFVPFPFLARPGLALPPFTHLNSHLHTLAHEHTEIQWQGIDRRDAPDLCRQGRGWFGRPPQRTGTHRPGIWHRGGHEIRCLRGRQAGLYRVAGRHPQGPGLCPVEFRRRVDRRRPAGADGIPADQAGDGPVLPRRDYCEWTAEDRRRRRLPRRDVGCLGDAGETGPVHLWKAG